MAKVYEILPSGDKQLITTVDDLPITDQQVELLIEDIDSAPLSYDAGERYVFGGSSGSGRWICISGLKAWYQTNGIAAYNNSMYSIDSGNSVNWNPSFIEDNDIKNNLLFNFNVSTQGDGGAHKLTLSSKSDGYIYVKMTRYGTSQAWEDKRFSAASNFKYLGVLPLVTQIDADNKRATVYYAFVVLDENGKPIPFETQEDGAWHKLHLNHSKMYFGSFLSGHPETIPFKIQDNTDYELYYALGLTDIYKKKTMQDVINILENNKG